MIKKISKFIFYTNPGRLLLMVLLVIAIGTIGAIVFEQKIEGFNPFNAFWWSIVTITTVGYGDISPGTTGGKIIAMVVMFFGIGVIGMLTGIIASAFVDLKFKERKGKKKLKKLKDHIILCGWNFSAEDIINEIHAENKDREIVIIAKLDESPVDKENTYFINGRSSDLNKLEMAAFEKANVAIIVSDESIPVEARDSEGILTALTIKGGNPDIYVCIELLDPNNIGHCERANIDEYIISGEMTAKLLSQASLDHGITKVISELTSTLFGNTLYKVPCHDNYAGLFFGDLLNTYKRQYDAIILAVMRENEFFTNPKSDFQIRKGDELILISEKRPEVT